ncbi:MAG: AAA family ATPase, partial [Candidatus Poribacteria bacterium]|nr:AAA family ATPase [Candidatus Poribacteria bacterium]
MDLFDAIAERDQTHAPLAARIRPRTFDEFVGQQHLLAPGQAFRREIEEDRLRSMILWGPPGCGKTTLARMVARMSESVF